MFRILKLELKRSFHSIGMLISLLIGLGCIFYKNYVLFMGRYQFEKLVENTQDTSYYPFFKCTFYNNWIVAHIDSAVLYIFYFFGILVALPYGISFYKDRKKGVIKNICTRIDRKKYLIAKYIAVFVTGGAVSAVVVTADAFISKLFYPYDFMGGGNTPLIAYSNWGMFVMKHLYLGALCYIVVWFVFGGLLSTVSLLVSMIADNVFTIQLTPFFLMLILFYLPAYVPKKYWKFFPYNFLRVNGADTPVTILALLFVTQIVLLLFVGIEKRRDIL